MIRFFKKYHKWLSIFLTVFIVLFSISGIILNHRKFFSSIDIDRSLMPNDYQYKNWNNAAVNSTLKLNNDSTLIYGNIGVWLTDSSFNKFTDFNLGFPKGTDNRKIARLLLTNQKELFAATMFGLYQYHSNLKKWTLIELPSKENRVVDLLQKNDTLFVMTRSFLFTSVDNKNFTRLKIPEPEHYDHKIGLFKTLWVIHSGEIYGEIGKLVVDFVGLVFIFLSITGFIYFINGFRIKKRVKASKSVVKIKKTNRWNLLWHNKLGWISILLLLISTATGMFLRPPLIAAVGNSKVDKIPYTELATPNPWFDILRRITYDDENKRFIIATMDGFFYSDDYFKSKLKKFKIQPPASIMGVTVLRKIKSNTWLVGSFEGLFEWNPKQEQIFDYIKKSLYIAPKKLGPPIGDYKITGYTTDFRNQEIFFDYDFGAANVNRETQFSEMPENIVKSSRMSLWNVALEFHTARIYKVVFGLFYILVIPLGGLLILFILISGFWLWYKRHRKSNNKSDLNTNIHSTMHAKISTNKSMQNTYRVNASCISCNACVELASQNFAMNTRSMAYVKMQPDGEQQEKACKEAMNICPVGAISRSESDKFDSKKQGLEHSTKFVKS